MAASAGRAGGSAFSFGLNVAISRTGVLALAVATLLLVGGSERAEAAGYWGPGYKICHPIKVQYGPMYVSAKNVRCRKAVRILKEWWLGPDDRQTHVEKGGYDYYRLDRYPGWLCSDGASAAAATSEATMRSTTSSNRASPPR